MPPTIHAPAAIARIRRGPAPPPSVRPDRGRVRRSKSFRPRATDRPDSLPPDVSIAGLPCRPIGPADDGLYRYRDALGRDRFLAFGEVEYPGPRPHFVLRLQTAGGVVRVSVEAAGPTDPAVPRREGLGFLVAGTVFQKSTGGYGSRWGAALSSRARAGVPGKGRPSLSRLMALPGRISAE